MGQIKTFIFMFFLLTVQPLHAVKNEAVDGEKSVQINGYYDVPKLIKNIKNIEHIVINDTDNSVFDKGSDVLFNQFMQALSQDHTIKSLTLNGTDLSGYNRHTALVKVLSGGSMQGLGALSLINNGMTSDTTLKIITSLTDHLTLHSLIINNNRITSFASDNMDKFAEILKTLPNLRSLNLSNTGLSTDYLNPLLFDEMIYFFKMERPPGPLSTLEHLNLSNNPLGYDGLNSIIVNLDEMPNLKTLKLENILQPNTEETNKIKKLKDTLFKETGKTKIETIYLGETSQKLAEAIEDIFRNNLENAPEFSKIDYKRANSFTSYADSTIEVVTRTVSSYWNSWFGSSDADTKKQEKEQAADNIPPPPSYPAPTVEDAIKAEREQAAREQAEREQAVREQAAREQAAREQAAREQAAREQAVREQAAREQAAREQAAREQAAREQAAREQAAREQAAREQAAREQRPSGQSSLLDQIKAGKELRSTSAQKKELTEEQEYVRNLIIDYTDMGKGDLEDELEDVGTSTTRMIRKVIVNSLTPGKTPKEISDQNRTLIGMNSLELEKYSFLSFANAEKGMEREHEEEGVTLLQLYIKKKVLELILEKYDVKTEAKQKSGKNDYYIRQLLDIVEKKQRMVNNNEETILDSSQLILDSLEIIKVLTRLYTTGLPDTITSIMSGNNAKGNIIKLILDDQDPFPFLKEKGSIKFLTSGNTYINISSALFKFWKLSKHITAAAGSEASLMAKELGNGRTDWDKLNDWVAEAGKIFSTAEIRNPKGKLIKVESPVQAEAYVAQLMRDMKSAVKDIQTSDAKKKALDQDLVQANEAYEFALEFDRNNPNVDLMKAQQNAQGGASISILEDMMKNMQ